MGGFSPQGVPERHPLCRSREQRWRVQESAREHILQSDKGAGERAQFRTFWGDGALETGQ
jgi:hypothetical protein